MHAAKPPVSSPPMSSPPVASPPAGPAASALPDLAADLLARVAARAPRVHCITNAVAQNFTANVLLAAGAVPSMTVDPGEIAAFIGGADALLVNLGTLDTDRREAVRIAIDAAAGAGRPWLLDPVFVDRSPERAAFARSVMEKAPPAVRLNAAEFSALAGGAPDNDTLQRYAREHACVVALTGATDAVTDSVRMMRIRNGDPLMSRVTAMGCAGAAWVAACLAVEPDPFVASAAGLLAFAVAGECAAARARGPGSFAVELIDALAKLDRDALRAKAQVE
jgi:hydroxyethylthiazole kinase